MMRVCEKTGVTKPECSCASCTRKLIARNYDRAKVASLTFPDGAGPDWRPRREGTFRRVWG